MTAIKALKEISGAKTSDVELGCTEMWFQPGAVKGGNYTIDIGTAGSITLLLQALILPCLFAPSKMSITVRGGTCGKWQASVDSLQVLLLPHLERFVKRISLKIVQRGYYPKGQGEVLLEISPKIKRKDFASFNEFLLAVQEKVKPISILEQGDIEQVKGILNLSSELEEKYISERIVNATKNLISEKINSEIPVQVRVEARNTASIGGELLLWTVHSKNGTVNKENEVHLSGDALLEQEKPSTNVAREAVEELAKEIHSEAAVDKYLADQLAQFMILLPGSSVKSSCISPHSETNWYVLEEFFPYGFSADKKGNIISVERE